MSSSYDNVAVANAHNILGQPPALKNSWLRPPSANISKIETKAACVSVKGETMTNCINLPVPITALTTGAVAKIPVVLAELSIQVNINAVVDLPEPAIEIKKMDNRLKLSQCLLLQDTNMLFIKGIVRKNIDYAIKNCVKMESICGDIRHCTLDVPFKCTTPVTFNGIEPLPVVPATTRKFEYFTRKDLTGPEFAGKDELLAGDHSQYNQISTEFFNELPFCELVSSRIIQFDEYINTIPPHFKIPLRERQFKSIEEKMVIFLTLKILQNRQVAIPAQIPEQ